MAMCSEWLGLWVWVHSHQRTAQRWSLTQGGGDWKSACEVRKDWRTTTKAQEHLKDHMDQKESEEKPKGEWRMALLWAISGKKKRAFSK